VILRCQPRPAHSAWGVTDDHPAAVRARGYRPSSVLWDGRRTWVLVEGHPDDVAAEHRAMGTTAASEGPAHPQGPHRGRVSLRPGEVAAFGAALGAQSWQGMWLAEVGVGTVHLATDHPERLQGAREVAVAHGGWMRREAGAPELDGFGTAAPNAALTTRVRDAFDPDRKLAPGRVPW
jgi:hypothetical protein